MLLERLQTSVLILGMLIFYFFIMPGQVDHIENARIVPTTVPTIAIWIIIVAASFQLFSSKIQIALKPRQCLRVGICAVFIIVCMNIIERFGFEYGGPVLAAGVMLFIGERRPHWLFLGVVVIPVGVWLLVEQVLDRILP